MRNVICIPFAWEPNKSSGVNIQGDAKLEIYLKCASVALVSAKKYNADSLVMLATNLEEEQISKHIRDILLKNEIEIKTIPYNRFCFPEDYLWSLAFYKLCVLSYLTEMHYDNICYMDADVYVQQSFENIWKECTQNIMLYDINHGLGTKDYQIICDEFDRFTETSNCLITHFGGEFFAANLENAKKFVKEALAVYNEMIQKQFVTTKGDEFIVSIAASKMYGQVKNCGAYIFRFWTDSSFRLVSTCYQYNPITILHMPMEKQRGLLRIFHKYIDQGKLPKNKEVWKMCRLIRLSCPEYVKSKLKMLLRR